ncbi:MAG: DNA-processing protein DprA [Myxococcota bacterium]
MKIESSPTEELAWVALAGLRLPLHPQHLLECLGSPLALFQNLQTASTLLRLTDLQKDRIEKLRWSDVARQLEQALMADCRFISYLEDAYPARLKQLPRPPAGLWVRGMPEALSLPLVAVVGARQASPYGLHVARDLSRGLVKAGLGIISGGALGIDAAAHRAALEAEGRSIAVFGTGILQDYPPQHRGLFQELCHHGCCVSELAPLAPVRPEHFPIRNRIISGLSLGVVVVEAGERSGSLITVRYALEQDREVFAVPGPISSPLSVGPHRLIKQGAKLVTSAEDILEELRLQLPLPLKRSTCEPEPTPPLEGTALSVWERLRHGAQSLEQLSQGHDESLHELFERLLELELGGWIQQIPGGRYERCKTRTFR